MTGRDKFYSRQFKKAPFLELLIGAVVVASNSILAPKPRIASDALFLEGMTLLIAGTLIARKIFGPSPFPSSFKRKSNARIQTQTAVRHGLWASITKGTTGLRMLLVGLVLVAAAVIIGELSRLL